MPAEPVTLQVLGVATCGKRAGNPLLRSGTPAAVRKLFEPKQARQDTSAS